MFQDMELGESLVQSESSIFESVERMGHEQVVFCSDKATGLKSIISIHDTTLGPSLGGVRLWQYEHEKEALRDVLRLSRGMTYKSALAGLNLGGGKAVIIGSVEQKNEVFLRRFGQFVDTLGGRYWTAEDVNMSTRDMEYIRMETSHVVGLPGFLGGSGDPSPVTAYGVYVSMKAACRQAYGSDKLSGRRILVQGAAGQVGKCLVRLLAKEDAKILVSDIQESRIKKLLKEHKAQVVDPSDVYETPAEIFVPCALGGVLNQDSIPKMNFDIIAGAANNQLEDEHKDAERLRDKKILYAPDFLINCGGVISVYFEYIAKYNKDAVYTQTGRVYDTLMSTFKMSEDLDISTQEAAMRLAEERIGTIRKIKR